MSERSEGRGEKKKKKKTFKTANQRIYCGENNNQ